MNESIILIEEFNNNELNSQLRWFSPPKEWELDRQESKLIFQAEKGTDFWQKTHYDFQVDNGHFLFYEMRGDFRLTTKVKSKPVNLYDQAGLMVRLSSDTWLKTSVEYLNDSDSRLGAVVTNQGYSDWSCQKFSGKQDFLYYRITKKENTFYAESSLDGFSWNLMRMACLFEKKEIIQVGIYACSPQGEGYKPEFHFIKIETIDKDTEVFLK
ncbi:DUF1349 domain-containing protein [Bacillus sp. FJAT-50079]|uniref:DUF1349 domain-containing protein n=1 Tax=Bacillus sp. FJAT-50079 TaxID=2833577 RepID=UPI001BCA0317|nr:DUF1349 domain-containing protein [Bacillus sp. FJAT-50079]MBS4207525.1 DUF1349 domain-containing protein [Bacillus sp. FJAT-50079]